MFKKLFSFEYKRTTRQAVGFYLFYLFCILLLSIITAFAISPVVHITYRVSMQIGSDIAIIVCLLLSLSLLWKKNLVNSVTHIILVFLAVFLAFMGGGLLGLIPVAYLTTQSL